jgi:hypothetical protein
LLKVQCQIQFHMPRIGGPIRRILQTIAGQGEVAGLGRRQARKGILPYAIGTLTVTQNFFPTFF